MPQAIPAAYPAVAQPKVCALPKTGRVATGAEDGTVRLLSYIRIPAVDFLHKDACCSPRMYAGAAVGRAHPRVHRHPRASEGVVLVLALVLLLLVLVLLPRLPVLLLLLLLLAVLLLLTAPSKGPLGTRHRGARTRQIAGYGPGRWWGTAAQALQRMGLRRRRCTSAAAVLVVLVLVLVVLVVVVVVVVLLLLLLLVLLPLIPPPPRPQDEHENWLACGGSESSVSLVLKDPSCSC